MMARPMTGRRLGTPACRRLSLCISACIRAKIISCSHSQPRPRCRCSYRPHPPLRPSRRPRRRRLSTHSLPITLVDKPLATTPPTKPVPKCSLPRPSLSPHSSSLVLRLSMSPLPPTSCRCGRSQARSPGVLSPLLTTHVPLVR